MQSAETVLGVVRERGRRGLPVGRLYRQLFNPQLYLLAYGKLYSNKGAMTPGGDGETVDGMSLGKIGRIIDALRHERYRWSPARRVYIPKKDGKKRPLGLPSWSDKLVGEVVRMLLEAYYEPQFSGHSHGYRPGRGCHTALGEVSTGWHGTTWFIEGDISDCFGSLDHKVMLDTLAEKIHDERFLRLVRNMLTAGYLQDWVWHATLSGAPQGGVVSPILSNIYLHRLDMFVETVLIPEYTRGRRKIENRAYRKMRHAIARARKRGDRVLVRQLTKQWRSMPSLDPQDPGHRRLRYCRYADDTLLGFVGPRAEAEQIKQRLAAFLRDDLKLELSHEKTLITHARTGAARFLGYEISVWHDNRRISRDGQRKANGLIKLRVPTTAIKARSVPYLRRGQPAHQPPLMNLHDHTIINTFGVKYRGIVQYYLLAHNVAQLSRLHWVMQKSLLRTLAAKYDSSVVKMAKRYRTVVDTPHGPRKCIQVSVDRGEDKKPLVARFGGIPLRWQRYAVLTDREPVPISGKPKELIGRLLKGRCEACGKKDKVQVHHVRKLDDLTRSGQPHQPEWVKLMIKRRRKTLIVCDTCHGHIHPKKPTASTT